MYLERKGEIFYIIIPDFKEQEKNVVTSNKSAKIHLIKIVYNKKDKKYYFKEE